MRGEGRPLSKRQIAYLHTVISRNGIADAEYRELLEDVAGVRTAKALDQAGLTRVLDLIEAMGFDMGNRSRPRPAPAIPLRRGMATPRQIGYIEDLADRVFAADQQRFRHWLEHYFKVTHLRFLPALDAQRAIEALKAMQERGYQTGG